jgi:hypothetical protein
MLDRSCLGFGARHTQHDKPEWKPLLDAVGERLAEGFMWMHEDALDDGSPLHAYKHYFTRRYLYLTEDGRAFELTPCQRFVPLRLDFAIEHAVCSWWILDGWEEADVTALRDAIVRAADRVPAGS